MPLIKPQKQVKMNKMYIFNTIIDWGTTMQLMTAKDARNHFGDLMNTMQREPVFITKNNKPVGAFISIEDLKDTHIMDDFLESDDEYQQWLQKKLTQSYENFNKNGSNGVTKEQAKNIIKQRLLDRVSMEPLKA